MRLSQPIRAVPLRIQHSSEWAGTALCAKMIDLAGSIPLAISAAAISRTLDRALGRIHIFRQRVEVGEEVQALGLILHPHPAQDRAEQIAEMEAAGRLDARNDPLA